MEPPYTICFRHRDGRLLMLHRRYPPNAGCWNGLGGKIEANESPLAAARREVLEESDILLDDAASVRFAGIVTWAGNADPTGCSRGTYAFVADLPVDWPVWKGERVTDEGTLCWKPVAWACDAANPVVPNVPRFLPLMLAGSAPREYFCDFTGGSLKGVYIRPLPAFIPCAAVAYEVVSGEEEERVESQQPSKGELPDVHSNSAEPTASVDAPGEMPCPVCGHPMPDLKGGKGSICPVCGFKDSCCY
jgi:8-oxo-dGTP diphosphatase